jgi:type I restriction enzyme, S subunit
MSSGWTLRKIAEVADIYDGPHATPTKTQEGPWFLSISSLNHGRLELAESAHLSGADFVKWTRRVTPEPGDVLFSYETRLGEAALMPDGLRACLGRRMGLLRPHGDLVNPRFLLYAYLSPEFRSTIERRAIRGATVDRIPLNALGNWPIRVPDRPTQDAIAEALGALDDKIELNQRITDKLVATVRAIFKSWFVDFDPTRATLKGRLLVHLDAKTAALFSSSLTGSPIGPIPEGWSVAALGDHIEVARGLSYTGAGLAGKGLPLHNLNSVYEGGGYKYDGIKFYVGEHQERHLVRPSDVVVANTEQGFDYLLIGYPAIIPLRYGERGLFSQDLFRLRPRTGSPLTGHFLYSLLLSRRFREDVVGYTNGTTVNHLAIEGLRRPLFVIPPTRLIQKFEYLVAPMFSLIESHMDEARNLAELRNMLLPKLMSGELQVETIQEQLPT